MYEWAILYEEERNPIVLTYNSNFKPNHGLTVLYNIARNNKQLIMIGHDKSKMSSNIIIFKYY